MEKTTAVAYPGIPVIFAEGLKDYEDRISYHDSVGLAVTDVSETVRTETSVEAAGNGITFLLNGKPVEGKRAGGMLKVVTEMRELAGYDGGLKISSHNHNILSGSSDSGAAALVVALNGLLELQLTSDELLQIGHHGSETVFRSLYGGLTEYGPGELKAELLAENLPVAIFAVPFKSKRFSADRLHLAVVKHPGYGKRAEDIRDKIDDLKRRLKAGDIPGFLSLMESDAKEVHRMFRETGYDVIKPEMRELCDFIEKLRETGVSAYWNVAGGSCVYVFCPGDDREKVRRELKTWPHQEYKIAGGAVTG